MITMMEVSDWLPDHMLDRMFAPDDQWWKMAMPDDTMAPTIKRGDALFVEPCYELGAGGFYVLRSVHRDPQRTGDTICRCSLFDRSTVSLCFDGAPSLNRQIGLAAFNESVIGRVIWAALAVE